MYCCALCWSKFKLNKQAILKSLDVEYAISFASISYFRLLLVPCFPISFLFCQNLYEKTMKMWKIWSKSYSQIPFFKKSINWKFYLIFCIKKYRHRFQLGTQFLILLIFLESLTIVLINMVTILMMSAKMTTPGLFKAKIFWKKDYDVRIFFLWRQL